MKEKLLSRPQVERNDQGNLTEESVDRYRSLVAELTINGREKSRILEERTDTEQFLIETLPPAENEAEYRRRVDEARGSIDEVFQEGEMTDVLDSLSFEDDSATLHTRSHRYSSLYNGVQTGYAQGNGTLHAVHGFFSKEYNRRRERFESEHRDNQPHEMVGMAKAPDKRIAEGSAVHKIKRRGVAGMLGFKNKQSKESYRNEPDMVENPETGQMEQGYIFEYNFIDTFDGAETNATGKKSGQRIQARIKLPESQAKKMAEILQKDPTTARTVVDRYVRERGDIGAWLADSYPDSKDPTVQERESAKRRPNYEDYPDLKPDLYLPEFMESKPEPPLLRSHE